MDCQDRRGVGREPGFNVAVRGDLSLGGGGTVTFRGPTEGITAVTTSYINT